MAAVPKAHEERAAGLAEQSWFEFWLCRIWLPLGLFIQLTGFFWLPNTHIYKVNVTNILLLAALLSLFNREAWRMALRSTLFPLILLYLFYMSAVAVLRQNPEPLACAHWSVYIALYIFAIGLRLQLTPRAVQLLLSVAAIICAAAVLYGVGYDLLYRHRWSETYRLTGYATLYNPLRSGHLFGFFYIAALWRAFANEERTLRWPFVFIAAICLIGIVFTGSRAPLLGAALAGSYLIFFAAKAPVRRISLLISTVALVVVCALFWQQLTERGLSLRPQIWSHVLKLWQAQPWFGAGYNAPLDISLRFIRDDFYDAHNIVLAVLYYGGIVGVLLFGLVHGTALVRACRRQRSSAGALLASSLMIYGLIALQFDGGSIIGRPNEFWLLLWFPIALLLNVEKNSSLPVNRRI